MLFYIRRIPEHNLQHIFVIERRKTRFEILAVVLMKTPVLLRFTPSELASSYSCILQGYRRLQFRVP